MKTSRAARLLGFFEHKYCQPRRLAIAFEMPVFVEALHIQIVRDGSMQKIRHMMDAVRPRNRVIQGVRL